MSIYAPTKRPLSMIGRMHAANAAADARRADKLDEGNRLRRTLRSEMMAQSGAAAFAAGEWHKLNDAIPTPAACGGGKVHPSRARRLAEFMASEGWSADPAEPIEATPTLAEAIEAGTVEARERLAAAERAYAAYEANKYDTDLDEPEPIEAPIVAVDTVAEPVKRGRGRPPRISLDRDAADDALPLIR